MKANKGFTLIEMLVVIGIIAVLTAASVAGFSRMTKSAEDAKARELVTNTATALSALYQREGAWPKRILAANAGENKLDAAAAYPLASYMSLKTKDGALSGLDRFGILDNVGAKIVKNKGKNASRSDVEDHILNFAVDTDDDGVVEVAKLGLKVRASAVVWGYDKNGKRISSWSKGQENKVD